MSEAAARDPSATSDTESKSALECDIVMAGGVTSGVVYPGAVVEIAKTYRFRNIGGASVGAIVAAAVAAAEYGRRTRKNPDAFADIAKQPAFLGKTIAGRTRLFHMFKPQSNTASLFRLVGPLFTESGWFARVVCSLAASCRALGVIAPTLGALIIGLVALTPLAHDDFPRLLLVILACVALGALTLLAAIAGHLFRLWIPAWTENNFGLCSGYDKNASPDTPSLTGWLHAVIQRLAGRSEEHSPLTFGELWTLQERPAKVDPSKERAIDLATTTSDLSHGRSAQLPFIAAQWPLYVDRKTLTAMFPETVVDWIMEHGQLPDRDVDAPEGVVRLPEPADLPIVFAARMSLSFPGLLSATPLWTPNFRAASNGRSPLRRVWFSDGGITSNFPVHFFDSPLPRRPTFCINLIDAEAEAPIEDGDRDALRTQTSAPGEKSAAHVFMLKRNDPAPPAYEALDPSSSGVLKFFKMILNTARFWNDNQLLGAPGVRDRIVNIELLKGEGGLNLNMSAATLESLDRRGQAAGDMIADRFAPKRSQGASGSTFASSAFVNHRWVRYRSFMAAFEDLSRRYATALRRTDAAAQARGEPKLADIIDGRASDQVGYPAPPGARAYFHWATDAADTLARDMAARTRANAAETFDRPGAKAGPAAPRPKMRGRLRPIVDDDPRAEFAEPP